MGKGKAETAAKFIVKRVSSCHVTPHMCRIQTLESNFYRQFKVIISGLDNIEARRWLNSMIMSMVEYDADGDPDPTTIIPLIDGGTEGFKGQARVIMYVYINNSILLLNFLNTYYFCFFFKI